jgi:O-antigen ligase
VSGSKKVFLILLSCLLFIAVAGPAYWNRISTIRDYEADDSGRILVWKRSLVIAASHPILGVGPDAFMTAYGDFLEKDRFPKELSRRTTGVRVWQTAHSAYLLVLVELGIPGLLLFLAINYRSLRNLRKIRQLDLSEAGELRTLQPWSHGLTISLIGFLTCGLFISQSYNSLIYLICALSGSILRILTPSQVSDQTNNPNN